MVWVAPIIVGLLAIGILIIYLKSPQTEPESVIFTSSDIPFDDEIERDVSATVAYLRGLTRVGDSSVGITGFCGGGRIAYLMAARNDTLAAAAVFHGGSIMAARGDAPSPFDLTAQISCPVAGFFGDDDENPSKEDVAKIGAEMDRLDKAHQFHSYPEAGHAFLDFSNAKAYRRTSADDAWDKLVAFLGETLKAAVGAAS